MRTSASSSTVESIVLFSGDGDFRRLIEPVRVSVISTLRSSPPMVADELRRQADSFIELQDLAPQIARAPRQTESRVPTPARPDLIDTPEVGPLEAGAVK